MTTATQLKTENSELKTALPNSRRIYVDGQQAGVLQKAEQKCFENGDVALEYEFREMLGCVKLRQAN